MLHGALPLAKKSCQRGLAPEARYYQLGGVQLMFHVEHINEKIVNCQPRTPLPVLLATGTRVHLPAAHESPRYFHVAHLIG